MGWLEEGMWLRVWCAVEVEAGRGRGNGAVWSLVGAGPGAVRWGWGRQEVEDERDGLGSKIFELKTAGGWS